MTLSLEQLSARMRQGENIPLSDTARIALALSIPSILEQLVVTAMEYIDAAMVGHIGAEATAAIGDSENDRAMLARAGVAAVMANALPEIRALGDIVSTRDNDHDGVAELFERLGL